MAIGDLPSVQRSYPTAAAAVTTAPPTADFDDDPLGHRFKQIMRLKSDIPILNRSNFLIWKEKVAAVLDSAGWTKYWTNVALTKTTHPSSAKILYFLTTLVENEFFTMVRGAESEECGNHYRNGHLRKEAL
jgi:hypothetical protein